MKVTVLGCGGSAGVPQLGGVDGHGDWGACDPAEPRNRRTRSSIVVQSDTGERLLVDTSPDLRAQLLACGVPRVDSILFTHAHADHVLGIDDVRILNRLIGRPLDAFMTARTRGELEQRFDYALKPWSGTHFFRPALVPHTIEPGDPVATAGLHIRTFEQDHGYMTTLGLRIGPFGYSTDVARLDETGFAVLEGVDTWLVDCFQRRPHSTHAGIDQVMAWAERLRPRRTVLTHMGYDLDWAWLQQRLPAGMEAARDGLVFEFP